MKSRSFTIIAAAILAGSATPGIAQGANTAGATADPYATPAPQDDDDDFPWGLLGLLGLAGLLGLKRRDRDDDVRRTPGGTGRV